MIPTISSAFVASAPSSDPRCSALVGVDDSLRDEDEDRAGKDAERRCAPLRTWRPR